MVLHAAIFVYENVSGCSKADFENRSELFERMAGKNCKFVWGAQSTIDIYKKPDMLKLMHAAMVHTDFGGEICRAGNTSSGMSYGATTTTAAS